MKVLLLSALLAFPFTGAMQDKRAQDQAPPPPAPADPQQALIDFQKPCYPLKTCGACGSELDKSAVPLVLDKRLVMVCNDVCKGAVEGKKADVFKAIDEGVIAAQKAAYPLEKCPISGEKLGGMGEPVDKVVGMRLVRLCCNGCVSKLESNPEPTLGKLDRAYIASQKATYGVDVCAVSGEKLEEGKAIDVLYGTTLVRLCCNDCKSTLNRAPQRVLNRLANIRAGKPADDGADKEKKKDGEGRKKDKEGNGEGGGREKKKDGEKAGG